MKCVDFITSVVLCVKHTAIIQGINVTKVVVICICVSLMKA